MDAAQLTLTTPPADSAVVELAGELDFVARPELERTLDRALAHGAGVVVDLSGVTFLDSMVIGLLVKAYKDASAGGHGFALQLGDTPLVQRLLRITGLDGVIAHASDRESALALVRPT